MLIITHFRKIFKQKFSDLAANSLAHLQKEKAPLEFSLLTNSTEGIGTKREVCWLHRAFFNHSKIKSAFLLFF